ncbi:MAG: DUF115 domain-containing protein, partial [Treponema sp.]|nr:DUF115 domain-containing protein [Treponema sp.]
MIKADFESFEKNAHPLIIERAKNGSPTALEANASGDSLGNHLGTFPLHSKYNPEREAQQLISNFSAETHQAAVFICCGLGYAPLAFVKKYPDVPIIILEPNPVYLLQAFAVLDWKPILTHENVTIVVQAPLDITQSILSQYKSSTLHVFSIPSQTAHCKEYAENIKSILKKNEQKENINTNTLEKFSHLWLRNSCRNLRNIEVLDGIQKFAGLNQKLTQQLPFIVLAAGPSLETILPHLAELQKRSITVCVDTALHSCLAYDIEPDFIILVDPQYACAMHLEFLSAPHSILVAESAVWPSVFRVQCKEIVLCSSMFPIGQYFEKQLGQKGKLGAGGSVSTTAWDFARICGARSIYMAGMDLGFPGKQTH